MKSFKDKVVVITGAGSGIGRELAVQCAQLGAHLAIADIREDSLQETARLLSGRVSTHIVDVSRREQVYQFTEDVIQQHGQVDVVINNAGVSLSDAEVKDISYEEIEWVLGINLWGVIHGTKAFLPILLKRPEAHIVNVASVLALVGMANLAPYSASKFAVRGFTDALRKELSKTNIGVTIVYPGSIKTNIARHARIVRDANASLWDQTATMFEATARTSAAKAAKLIIKGIQKNAPRVLVGPGAHWLNLIARITPA